jgi:hypothetical protein
MSWGWVPQESGGPISCSGGPGAGLLCRHRCGSGPLFVPRAALALPVFLHWQCSAAFFSLGASVCARGYEIAALPPRCGGGSRRWRTRRDPPVGLSLPVSPTSRCRGIPCLRHRVPSCGGGGGAGSLSATSGSLGAVAGDHTREDPCCAGHRAPWPWRVAIEAGGRNPYVRLTTHDGGFPSSRDETPSGGCACRDTLWGTPSL